MSTTPRTDALWRDPETGARNQYTTPSDWRELCEELERENADLRKQLAHWIGLHAGLREHADAMAERLDDWIATGKRMDAIIGNPPQEFNDEAAVSAYRAAHPKP